ncbi:putative DUF2125 domain-containing protein [uncultured Gammaproteobacteria bacterium]
MFRATSRWGKLLRIGLVMWLVMALPSALYVAWWVFASFTIRGLVTQVLEGERDAGSLVEYDQLQIGGFPLALRVSLGDSSIFRPDGSQWQSAGVSAEARPWRLRAVQLTFNGRQRLQVPAGSALLALTMERGQGRLDANPELTAVDGGWLSLTEVTLAPAGAGAGAGAGAAGPGLSGAEIAAATTTAATFDLSLSRVPQVPTTASDLAATVDLVAFKVRLPSGIPTPLGRTLDLVNLSARLTGPLGRLDPEGLATWSRAGGAIEIDSLKLSWGPLHLEAKGRLTLDGALHPEGPLTVELTGTDQLLETLVVGGLVRAKDAPTVRSVLHAMSRKPASNDPGTIEGPVTLPLVIRKGFLFLGPIKLMPLPWVGW